MDPLLSTALEAAEAAAHVHLLHFGEVGLEGAVAKAHSDFVSRVDLEAQEAALGVIQRRHPGHEILAEEDSDASEGIPHASEGKPRVSEGIPNALENRPTPAGSPTRRSWPEDGGYLWIVDPLDGTTNYLHGHPQFAASVGVGRFIPGPHSDTKEIRETTGSPGEAGLQGRVVSDGDRSGRIVLEAGAVVAARTGERWWAARGGGAFKNGLPLRVSGLRDIGTALVGTGFPFKEPELVPRYLEQFQRVLPASGGIRRAGSAALDLCYLAEGILDGFWEEDYLSPWDVAAGLVILREAGGVDTRLDGSGIDLNDGSVLAANSWDLHQQLGDLIQGE